MRMKLLVFVAFLGLASSMRAEAFMQTNLAWKASVAAMLASHAADTASSWGMRELNPVLRGRDQTFDGRSAAIKLGVVGAIIGVEYLIMRRHPKSLRLLTRLNWTTSIITGGIAAHNFPNSLDSHTRERLGNRLTGRLFEQAGAWRIIGKH